MQSPRKMFTKTQLLFCCIIALLGSAGAAIAVRNSPLWGALTEPTRRPLWTLASLSDPVNAQEAQRGYAQIVARRDAMIPREEQDRIIRGFQGLTIWNERTWQGVRINANPGDLWVTQQIIYDIRPDYIIETGTGFGGCALYYAQVLEHLNLPESRVITVGRKADIHKASQHRAWKERIEHVDSSSIDQALVARISERTKGKVVLVILGSSRDEHHVSEELRLYSPMISRGSYIVVRDTSYAANVPSEPPERGLERVVSGFLNTEAGTAFVRDTSREAIFLTFNRGGWLKRRE